MNSPMLSKERDILIHLIDNRYIIFICLFIIAYTIYFLNLLPWWDGTTTVVTSIETIRTENLYTDFFGKPPFIFLSLGSLIKIFGYSPALIHIFMLIFSLTAIIYTYRTGKFLFKNENIALAASGLLAISPLFIAQAINLNFDLPSMALIMTSYYYLLKKNYIIYAIVGSLLVMTKEIGILFGIAVILSTVINYIFNKKFNKKFDNKFDNKRYKDIRKVFIIQMIPIVLFILWAYGNYINHGWFIFPRDSPILKFESILNDNFYMRIKQLFIINFNWILTIIMAIFGIMQLYKNILSYKNRKDNDIIYTKLESSPMILESELLCMILFAILFFLITAPIKDFNLPRYVISLYPQFYLTASWTIFNLIGKNKEILWIVVLAIIVLFVGQTVYNRPFIFLDPVTQKIYSEKPGTILSGSEIMEINLNYVNYVRADIELARFINGINTSVPAILNRFNHYNMFMASNKEIDLGYDLRSRPNIDLNSFYKTPDKIKLPAILIVENFNRYDIERLSNMYNVTLMKDISVGRAGVTTYWIDNR